MWKNRKNKMILTTYVCINNEAHQNYDVSHIRVANNHFSIISYLMVRRPHYFSIRQVNTSRVSIEYFIERSEEL